jgi:tetratricopeptide (TPR) repeat protein
MFGASVGAIAGGMAALYGPLLFFETRLLPVSLAVFLDLLGLWGLMRAGPGWWLSGWAFGLAGITVPNILAFVPLGFWYLWRRRGVSGFRRGMVLFWMGVWIPVGGVGLRNYIVAKDIVPISYNGGVNFYIGNTARYARTVGARPGHAWEELAGEPLRKGIEKPSAQSRYFLHKAFEEIRDDPVGYVGVLVRKMRLLWSGEEIKRNEDVYYDRGYSPLLWALLWKRGIGFPFGLLGPLGLVGVGVWLIRRPNPSGPGWMAMCFVFAYMASVWVFFPAGRYRLPAVLAFLPFSAYALEWGWTQIRGRTWPNLAWATGVYALLVLGSNWGTTSMLPEGDAEVQYHLGCLYRDQGMLARALVHFGQATRLDTTFVEAWENVGAAYAAIGQPERAVGFYRRALALRPERRPTRRALAGLLAASGQQETALAQYARLLEEKEEAGPLRELGDLRARRGEYGEAEQAYRRALELSEEADGQELIRSLFGLGFVLGEQGESDQAESFYQALLEKRPRDSRTWNNLGVLYAREGRTAEALRCFHEAITLRPHDAEAWGNLARAYEVEGRLSEAAQAWERMVMLHPEEPEGHRELARVYKAMGMEEKAQAEWSTFLRLRGEYMAKEIMRAQTEAFQQMLR